VDGTTQLPWENNRRVPCDTVWKCMIVILDQVSCVLHCVVVRCSVLQCVAVRCSALQRVAVRWVSFDSVRMCTIVILDLVSCVTWLIRIFVRWCRCIWISSCIRFLSTGVCDITDRSCAVTHQMHHTATHCNTLQHTATHCNTLQHTATHCRDSSDASHVYYMYHVPHTSDPCVTCQVTRRVVYLTWVSHVANHDESCRKSWWVISQRGFWYT